MSCPDTYLERAAKCRKLAEAAKDSAHRNLLLETAQTWEFLAKQFRIHNGTPSR